jgi:hypothetical protein
MYPSSDIRPKQAADIFKLDGEAGPSHFSVGPVVLKIPERPNRTEPNLFVVVEGWIAFDRFDEGGRPNTLKFGTKVGYFRILQDGGLEHVYGSHFDMDEQLVAHPVFHGQMTSQAKLGESIEELFHSNFEVTEDHAVGLLGTVRTPTAQMDVFSVLTQVGADHLINEKSDSVVREGFDELRRACDFFNGAGRRFPFLCDPPATHCYRSTHWYERHNPPAAP